MKIPKCKNCGKEGHYAFQCFSRPMMLKATKNHQKNVISHRKKLIAELDKITSELVRKSQANKNGLVYCYTCGVRKPWQKMDCGHYRSRRFVQTRFDLDNLRPQCQLCNRYKHGNLEIYRQKLIRELGEEKVREIETKPSRKPLEIELENLLEQRKQALANLSRINYN